MIVKLVYQDSNLKGFKTLDGRKNEKTHYIRYILDEFSIDEAIQKIKRNKGVVALDYEGDLGYLFELKERPSVPLIYKEELTDVNELSISFVVEKVPSWVRVAIKTPEDFSDMRLIEKMSKKYPNLRFCCGTFLRLPGCNVGCVSREDLPDKIPDSAVKYYTTGCACIPYSIPIDEVEGLEYVYMTEEEIAAQETDKKLLIKKKVKSLEDLLV